MTGADAVDPVERLERRLAAMVVSWEAVVAQLDRQDAVLAAILARLDMAATDATIRAVQRRGDLLWDEISQLRLYRTGRRNLDREQMRRDIEADMADPVYLAELKAVRRDMAALLRDDDGE